MRAVALSSTRIQKRIAKDSIPLKVVMTYPKRSAFPLDWPALRIWTQAYERMDGKGFTGCALISHDLQVQYAHTGSAMVWELFDSTAYDEARFFAMVERGAKRAAEERALRTATGKSLAARTLDVARFRAHLTRKVEAEGPFRLPPRGFRIRFATELFALADRDS